MEFYPPFSFPLRKKQSFARLNLAEHEGLAQVVPMARRERVRRQNRAIAHQASQADKTGLEWPYGPPYGRRPGFCAPRRLRHLPAQPGACARGQIHVSTAVSHQKIAFKKACILTVASIVSTAGAVRWIRRAGSDIEHADQIVDQEL